MVEPFSGEVRAAGWHGFSGAQPPGAWVVLGGGLTWYGMLCFYTCIAFSCFPLERALRGAWRG